MPKNNENENTFFLKREFLKKQRLMILSITRRCKLRCKYCRNEKNDDWYDSLGRNTNLIDLAKTSWEEVAKIALNSNIGEILLTGGEPLDYPLIVDFIKFLLDRNIRFSIHTNGYGKYFQDVVNFLISEEKKINFHISIELYEELQYKLRNTQQPNTMIEFLLNNNFNIELKVILHSLLIDYVDQLENSLEYWKNIGIGSINFQPIVPLGSDFPDDLILNENFLPFIKKLKEIKSKNTDMEFFIRNTTNNLDVLIEYLSFGKVSTEKIVECKIEEKILFVNTDLDIFNCKTLWGKDKNSKCIDVFDFICCGFQK
ncbi:MAG: radical SAM protein [Promethearchaeota archaeon]